MGQSGCQPLLKRAGEIPDTHIFFNYRLSIHMQYISLIRYKKDLRIADHLPLYEACQWDLPVIGLYVREPDIMHHPDYSHFHQYRTQESLKDLKSSLSHLNIPLIVMYGSVQQALDTISQYYTIQSLLAHEETGNALTYDRDRTIIKYCKNHHISFHEYPSNGVVRKLPSRDARDTIRKQRILKPLTPIPSPRQPFFLSQWLQDIARQSLVWFPRVYQPATRTHPRDQPWEQSWQERLQHFVHRAWSYRYAMSRPELSVSVSDSSRLSGFLTYGNLSIKQVYHATSTAISQLAKQHATSTDESIKKSYNRQIVSLNAFRSRLHRHCHFIQKLESRTAIEFSNQNTVFDTMRTTINTDIIDKRYYGQTGIPMIDAGMRCLQATWWINFRMRATLVSFICNTCMQPRQAIAHQLARIFLDYEPGIHYSQLQMQAWTTGINTIRIYNPIKQLSEKDSDLTFVRRWVPELGDLSPDEVKLLGTAEGTALLESKNHPYPRPIIDVIQANREARLSLRWVMKRDDTKAQSKQVYQKVWSRKKPTLSRKKTPSSPKKSPSKKNIPQPKWLFDF